MSGRDPKAPAATETATADEASSPADEAGTQAEAHAAATLTDLYADGLAGADARSDADTATADALPDPDHPALYAGVDDPSLLEDIADATTAQATTADAAHAATAADAPADAHADAADAHADADAAGDTYPTIVDASVPPVPVQPAAQDEEEDEEEAHPMTLLDHLNELRIRLVRALIAMALGFFACYSFAGELFEALMSPLVKVMPKESKLIFTALPEAFFVYMQVAFVAGLFLASPYLFYQLWSFVAPGLYEEEKKGAIPMAFVSAFFFLSGATFCFFVVFPYAFEFFMGFTTEHIIPMPSLSEYLGFALKMLLAFGLIFEMPLFAFFLARMGLVTADMMRRFRKYAILAIFIVAAILTPPDVFSQLLMATPMLILYELSIYVAVIFGRKPKREEETTDEDGEEAPASGAASSTDTMQGH